MILSLEQYNALNNVSSRSAGQPPNTRYKLHLPATIVKLWDGKLDGAEHKWGLCGGDNKCVGVPYTMKVEPSTEGGFTEKQVQRMRSAMDEVEANTCIRYLLNTYNCSSNII